MNKHNTNTESEFNDNDFLKTEGKYRKLIDNAPLGMLIIKKGEIIVVNKALVKNLGYEKDEEIVGKKIMDFIAPEFKEIAKSRLSQLNSKEGEVVDNLEEKLIKKDGSLIDAIVVGHSLQLEGELVIQGYIYDVTEGKKVENELVESEKRFREVFLTSPDSININRLSDGLYVNVNEGFLKITGYTFEEVLGKTSKEINIWQNIKERDKLVALLEKNGSVLNFESKFRMKDGTVLDGLMSSSITSINGEPHIISVTRNISQLKLAQNKLKESEERLRIMFEHANAVMILINPETGKIVDANKTACDFYGYTHDKITSDITIYDINTNTSREAHDAMCHSVLDENKRFFLKHKLSDGTIRDVELYVGKIVLHGQVLLFAVIHDITERLKVELENQKLSKAVMQSPASLIITDTNGKIEFVNKMFTEISGYSWDEAIGKNPRILKSG
ncbi:MAG: PAS domain S-box protein, partial [Ignavibacteriae bacterium]|nr:PAS domain S-box protein [Ignavibacteriota bacterium]